MDLNNNKTDSTNNCEHFCPRPCAEIYPESLWERSPPSWIRANPLLMPNIPQDKIDKTHESPHTGDSKSCQYGDKAPLKPHISRGGGGGSAGRPFGILIQPVQEKFSRPIKLERTGISADARETTRTKMAHVHGLDSKIIVLWSSRIYLRLVHSVTFSVVAFSGCFTNILHLEIFFGFMVLLSVALLDRGKLSRRRRTKMANRRSTSLSVITFE